MRSLTRPLAAATTALLLLSGLSATAAAPAIAASLPSEEGTSLTYIGDPGAATSSAVSNASCDVNGDGIGDAVFGAWWWSSTSFSRTGAGYVVLGTENAEGGELLNPASVNAVRIDGPSRASALIGFSASCAGDLNADGYDDIVFGDYLKTSAYVIFGAANFTPTSIDEVGTRGFTAIGPTGDTRFGYSVSALGDVTGDGIDDLGVGSSTGTGTIYVIPGKRDITDVDLSADASKAALTVTGGTGFSLNTSATAGDVNGDGIDDLVVGAYTGTPWGSAIVASGAAYVIWGGQTGAIQVTDLGNKGFSIYGPQRQRDRLGVSVSAAGDLNGDGLSDLLIGADGATNAATGARNGGAAIVYGSKTSETVYTDPAAANSVYSCDAAGVNPDDASCLGGAQQRGYWVNGEAASDSAGYSVAGIGDVNGDGVADALIGAYGYDPVDPETDAAMSGAGAAYVVYGDLARTSTLELSSLTKEQGFRIDGGSAGDRFGRGVGSAGDFDDNGVNDLLIGADFAKGAAGATQSGQATVVLLGELKTSTSLSLQGGGAVGETGSASATVTSLVAGGAAVTAGVVEFSVAGDPISGCEAVATNATGTAVCEFAPAAGGEQQVLASFTGNGAKFAASEATQTLEVAKLSSSVLLSGDKSGASGDELEYTAVVPEDASGEVELLVNGEQVGTAQIVAGEAEFEFIPEAAGTLQLSARYAGDEKYEQSSSKKLRVTVGLASVYLSPVTLNTYSTLYGVQAHATVTVNGATSGNVLFRAAGKDIGIAEVDSAGQASLALPKLSAGSYLVTAKFLGDSSRADSAERAATKLLTVSKVKPKSAKATAKKFKKNTKPTVTVTVGKLSNGSYPTGKVTVKVGSYSKTVNLKASNKGKVTVKLGKKYKKAITVKASFKPSDTTNVLGLNAKSIKVRTK